MIKLNGEGISFSNQDILDMREDLAMMGGYSLEEIAEMDDEDVLGVWQAETGYIEPDED